MSESSSAQGGTAPFESALDKPSDRFLAQVMVHALDDGWRTPDDFLRHFPPADIIGSLAEVDRLRAALLVRAAGVHERLAEKKSVASGSEDLTIALEEGVCTAAGILDVYTPDERVRHLEHARLWAFVTEEGFWNTEAGEPGHATGVARITFIVERALQQGLITLQGIVEALTISVIAARLPEAVLRKVVSHALTIAANSTPLRADALFEVVPLGELISYVPLDLTWNQLVVAKLAAPHGLTAGAPPPSKKAAAPPAATAKSGRAPTAMKSGPPAPAAAAPKPTAASKPSASAPPPAPEPHDTDPPPAAGEDTSDDDGGSHAATHETAARTETASASEAEAPALSPAELDALNEAADALRAIGRLPPGYQQLSIPILRSIESMYMDLSSMRDDAEREAVIRESFPNEVHLRLAMLALIELLDPSIDTKEPLIRDADVDALIKIVLFEERRREEQRAEGGAPTSRRASYPPPRAGGPARRT